MADYLEELEEEFEDDPLEEYNDELEDILDEMDNEEDDNLLNDYIDNNQDLLDHDDGPGYDEILDQEFEPNNLPDEGLENEILEGWDDEPIPGQDLPRAARELGLSPTEFDGDTELVELLTSKIPHPLAEEEQDKKRRESARKLYREDKELLQEIRGKYEASPFLIASAPVIEGETELTTSAFLDMFEGGNPARVLGNGFKSREVGEHYDEGVEKLESLARIEGNYETEINYGEVLRDSLDNDSLEEIDVSRISQIAENSEKSTEAVIFDEELGQLIGEKMKEDPEEGQELIEKRDELKERIKEEKRHQAFEEAIYSTVEDRDIRERAYREIRSSNPDLDFLDPRQVKDTLGRLAEDHLSENSSAYHETERISDKMEGDEVSFEIYDKSLEEMPYKENRQLPCTFPGSIHDTSPFFINYMLDPATQVGKIETEKGDGVALMKMVEHEGEDFLYVHSVEADKGVNIASDKSTAKTIQRQIEEYAEELSQQENEIAYRDQQRRELDVEGVLYSMERHNNGTPGNFQDAIREDESFSEERIIPEELGLKHKAFDHDLESGVKAYKKEI